MIRGLYRAASGMMAAQHRNDVVADNLANVNTPGYKKDQGIAKTFEQELLVRIENASAGVPNAASIFPVGMVNSGVVLDQVVTVFSTGALTQTDSPTDLALEGPGFFTVSTPNGLRYTRSGSFRVDEAGSLVTGQGYQVMGTNGPVNGLPESNFTVLSDGSVQASGQTINKLAIADFAPGMLLKEGDNLFSAQGQPIGDQNFRVKQKFLEQSNVDTAEEMVNMMSALRGYEANQKVIQTMDASLEKAANEIGKI